MTSIGTPNWFAVTSAFFLLAGICFLAKAMLTDVSAGDETRQKLAKSERTVDLRFGLPLLIIGGILNVLAQVSVLSFGPAATSMSLALAFGLLLYASGRELVVDQVAGGVHQVRQKPKLAVLPAAGERRDADARVVELAAQS